MPDRTDNPDTRQDATPSPGASGGGSGRRDEARGGGAPPGGDGGGPAWPRRAARAVGLGLLVLVLALAGAVGWATRTDQGRRAVAAWIEDAVEGAVQGRVEIGPFTGGNLLTRAEIAGLSIREPDGEPFLVLEDLRAEYDPISLLRGRYAFRSVRIGSGRLYLRQDDDGQWNFDRLFADDGAGRDTAAEDGGTHLSLHDVRIRDGRVEVRTPFEPTSPDSQEVWRLERTPEGDVVRTIELASLSGRFPRLRLADPSRPMMMELEGVSGRALAVRQALPVREMNARAEFADTVRVRIAGARIGRSSVRGEGWVVPEDPPRYRFDLRADPMSFRDLQWIPVPMPAEGGGPAEVVVRSEGDVLAVDVRDADVTIADSRVRGALTVATAGTPRIDTLDVQLDPLRISRVNRILGRPTTVDGYVEGSLRGGGPIDSLQLSGDLSVRDTAGAAPASRVRLDGGVSLVEPNPVHDLRLRMEALEPKWAGVITVRPEVRGRLGGSLLLDGSPGDTMSFRADLVHRAVTDSVSRLRAEGRVADYGERQLRLDLAMSPLALDAADAYLDQVGLTGAVRGTLRTAGDLSDLQVTADVSTERGALTVDGSFGLTADPITYDARLTASGIQLRDWLDEGPYTRLALRGSVQGGGTEPGALEADFDLEILPSVVEGAVVDTSHLRFSVRDGLATVDSFDVRSDVGRVRGSGAFGLEEGTTGSLVITAEVPELSSWNRWLVPGRNPAGGETSVDDLFQRFPDAERRPQQPGVERQSEEAAPDTLAGELTGSGVVHGNVTEFSASGVVRGDSLSYGPVEADSATVTTSVARPERLDSLVASGDAWGVTVGRTRLDSVSVRWARSGEEDDSYRLYAGRDTSLQLASEGEIGRNGGRTEIRLDRLRFRVGPQELQLERPASAAWGETGLAVDTLRLAGSGGALLTADGELPTDGAARFDLQLRNLEAGLARVLYPEDQYRYGGSIDGALQVRGSARTPRMSGFLTVSQPRFAGVRFDSVAVNFQYRDRAVEFRSELRGGPGTPVLTADGTVRADLGFGDVEDRLPPEPVDVRVSAEELPLRVVELATESLRDVRGVARGDVRITGAPGSFRYDGRLVVTGVSADVPPLAVRYETERGAVRFREEQAALDSLVLASSAGGTLTVTGTIGLARPTDPGLDLSLAARKLRAIDRRTMSFVVDGTGRLDGSYEQPYFQGDLRVSNGEVAVTRFMQEREVVDLTDPDAYSLIDTTLVADRQLIREMRNPFLQNLRVEAQLAVGPDLWLRSQQMDVELAGELRVRMQPDQEVLQLFGPLRLVRGQYRYSAGPYSRQLQITGGTIEFVGTPGVNPNLNVTARYRARGPGGLPVTIEVQVGGTLIDKTLTLSSDVQMSESDQICYLLFSSPCVNVAGPSQGLGPGLTQTIQEQLVGSVGSQLTSLLVADTWLDYASVQTSSMYGGGFAGQTELLSTSLLAGTAVEAGKYLGESVFVSVTQPLGSRLPGATLEWQFRQNWTLEARTENRFGGGLLSLSADAFDTQRMWGLFLFREWGF